MALKLWITSLALCLVTSAQASFLDCTQSKWWKPEVVLDAPEDLAQFITIENDGELVKLQNSTDKSLYLVYQDKKVYRLVKNKVYKKVKVKSKDKWLKVQHEVLSDVGAGKNKKTDASYLILTKEDYKRFATSPAPQQKSFFNQLDKCGKGRLAGRPDANIAFKFFLNHNKESQVINGQVILVPNKNYNPEVPCCK
ncbi:MAG: hypothetical protein M9899_05110 [Bdellovibrionaceae bacterium]|nr:hypothetical protein [Pseudobdellovibrionaceae bacterium]